jgi:hypothetical protein
MELDRKLRAAIHLALYTYNICSSGFRFIIQFHWEVKGSFVWKPNMHTLGFLYNGVITFTAFSSEEWDITRSRTALSYYLIWKRRKLKKIAQSLMPNDMEKLMPQLEDAKL